MPRREAGFPGFAVHAVIISSILILGRTAGHEVGSKAQQWLSISVRKARRTNSHRSRIDAQIGVGTKPQLTPRSAEDAKSVQRPWEMGEAEPLETRCGMG